MNKSVSAVQAVVLGLSLGLVLVGCDSSSEQETASSVSSQSAETQPLASINAESAGLTGVVQTYCQVCHSDALMTGNLSLTGFEVENAPNHPETAEKMIRKLRAGMMPPPGMPRPSPETLLSLVDELET